MMSWKLGAIFGGIAGAAFTVATGGLGGIAIAGIAAAAASTATGAATGAAIGAATGGVVGSVISGTTAGSATLAATTATAITIEKTAKVSIALALTRSVASNLVESFIDNVIRDKVDNIPPGTVVYCDLHAFEHSGIYVGNNTIVHLDGSGTILASSPKAFLERLNGMNNAISIYASCSEGEAIGSKEVAKYAKKMTGKSVNYNIITNNCHKFTAQCIIGELSDTMIPTLTLKQLKFAVYKAYNATCWRVWDFES
jgi:hypothetical protein